MTADEGRMFGVAAPQKRRLAMWVGMAGCECGVMDARFSGHGPAGFLPPWRLVRLGNSLRILNAWLSRVRCA
jgi:hypothetical protein